MTPKIYTSLIIEKEILNEEIIDFCSKFKDSKVWFKGQKQGISNSHYKSDGCAIVSKPQEEWDIKNAIEDFWREHQLEELGLLDIIQRNELSPVLSLAIYVTEATPSIHLSADMMRILIEYNVELDIDIIMLE